MFTRSLQEARLDMTKISLKQIWDVYSAVKARYSKITTIRLRKAGTNRKTTATHDIH